MSAPSQPGAYPEVSKAEYGQQPAYGVPSQNTAPQQYTPPPQQPQYGQAPQPQQHSYAQAAPQYVGAQPYPGVPVRGPMVAPAPGAVITGYQIVEPNGGCSADLKIEGWLVVLILLLTFPCIAWVPCAMQDCQQRYQIPMYSAGGPQAPPVAQPYHG